MRVALALLVVAIAASGCTNGVGVGSSTTETAASTTSLSGPHVRAIPPTDVEGTNANGLLLTSSIQTDATLGSVSLTAAARNNGDATKIAAGCQATPWSERLEDPQGEVLTLRQPQPAMGCPSHEEDFPNGATVNFAASWNGTVWKGEGFGGAFARAAPGTYYWVIGFRTAADREGPATELRLELEVA